MRLVGLLLIVTVVAGCVSHSGRWTRLEVCRNCVSARVTRSDDASFDGEGDVEPGMSTVVVRDSLLLRSGLLGEHASHAWHQETETFHGRHEFFQCMRMHAKNRLLFACYFHDHTAVPALLDSVHDSSFTLDQVEAALRWEDSKHAEKPPAFDRVMGRVQSAVDAGPAAVQSSSPE